MREGVTAAGENVLIARSGYLPRIDAGIESGFRYEADNVARSSRLPYSVFVAVKQPVFDGFKTKYSLALAASQVNTAREELRGLEQVTLFEVARVYMDVLANGSILEFHVRYIGALRNQLALIRARRDFGDVVGSDVAEVEGRLAAAESQKSRSKAALAASAAEYRQITGRAPGHLAAVRPPADLISASFRSALDLAMRRHPAILASAHGIAGALSGVKVIESEFSPKVDIDGKLTAKGYGNEPETAQHDASLLAQVSIPLYRGGEVSARRKQATHLAAQSRLENGSIRDQVRAAVQTSWSGLEDANSRIRAAANEVKATRSALEGFRQAYQAGERTISDVLDAERDLLSAQIGQVLAERDRVVAIYSVALATGGWIFRRLPALSSARRKTPPSQLTFQLRPLRPQLSTQGKSFAAS